ncbi:Acyl-CoA dehydrogenase [gamma proteobacterium HdN1]|nr:Acyl-CoA dehydrogenase [gamma proteobacterium HdN1]
MPQTFWQRDTNDLPAASAAYREKLRDFSDRHLRPHALTLDQQFSECAHSVPQPAAIDTALCEAGRAGLLSDLLPWPLGCTPWARYRHSLVWQQSLRTEELARADGGLMLLLSAHNLGLAPILFSGNWQVIKQVVLPAFRACEQGEPQLFAFAITEPGAGSDAEEGHVAAHNKPELVAHPAPGGWRLRGRKVFISGGDRARWVVVLAALAGEGYPSWTAFLVDTLQPGFVRVRNEHKMGMRASAATELEFCDCFVPDARVLGGLRNGWALSRATLNFSRLPVASMAVGFAQAATDIATDHACRQMLGGRPLIHYQHMQLGIADLQAATASIRALVWEYARAWTPWQAKASIAKFQATDQAQQVIERAMDLCGEMGLTHAMGLEKIFRDNRLTRIFEGTNQINRLSVIEDQQREFLDRIRRLDPGDSRSSNHPQAYCSMHVISRGKI